MTNRRIAAILIVTIASLAGCGRVGGAADKKGRSHVALLTSLYARASSLLGHNPKNEQEFKDAIAKANVSLDALKVGSIDEVFTSDRDGQPLVVAYGAKLPGSDVVVYEKTGLDGKRLVGHKIGQIEEVDEARFRELVPAATPPGK